MGLDPGVLDEGRAGFIRLGQAEIAGRHQVEIERGEQVAKLGELALVVGGKHQPVAGMEPEGRHQGVSAFACSAVRSPMPRSAKPISWSSSARVKGACSAVPWISTKRPEPVMTKLASVSASESSR